jgi:hypothetical protein
MPNFSIFAALLNNSSFTGPIAQLVRASRYKREGPGGNNSSWFTYLKTTRLFSGL